MEVNAWIGNLGKYNEGELVGEWVSFPIDEDELEEVMERIGIDEHYEETFVADYDSELPLFKMFGEYPNYDDLNELAEFLESCMEEDVFEAIFYNEVDWRSAIATYESGNWIFWNGCKDMSDVARQIVNEDMAFLKAPEYMQRHFDYESYGEELDSCGTFLPCDSGIVEVW